MLKSPMGDRHNRKTDGFTHDTAQSGMAMNGTSGVLGDEQMLLTRAGFDEHHITAQHGPRHMIKP